LREAEYLLTGEQLLFRRVVQSAWEATWEERYVHDLQSRLALRRLFRAPCWANIATVENRAAAAITA
jgi:hypothetical protein